MLPVTVCPPIQLGYWFGVMSGLNEIQRAAQEQFGRQSHRYAKGHLLEDIADVQAALVQCVGLPQRAAVLDVATGAGHTGLLLARLGHQVILADITEAMLQRAGEKAREQGLTVELRQHPAEQLPYANSSFDLVTCRVAAHHFSAPNQFVMESARVLRHGGCFLLIDGSVADGHPEAEEWLHQVEKWRDPSHNRMLSQDTWRHLCVTAGLTILSSELQPMKQPDLEWYFATANTSPENQAKVLALVKNAPADARQLFNLGCEDGKIVWWWQRLSLVARKP